MTSQSASDSAFAVAARHHSRAPCGFVRRSPGAQLLLERAHLLGGLREFRAEAFRLPDLKLVAEADEGDLVLVMPACVLSGSVRIARPSPSIFNISLVP